MDGPAGAGKSTAAEGLARRLGAVRLDTGAIYRSLALRAQRLGISWDDGPTLGELASGLELRFEAGMDPQGVILCGEDVTAAIRAPTISQGASAVSRHPEVRSALLGLQRRLGAKGLVVAEGRDVGTTVFPDALVKIFLTASSRERAIRRQRELVAGGTEVPFEEVLAEQEARDRQDAQREASPLRVAEGAVVIDSSHLDLPAVVEAMLEAVVEAMRQAAAGAEKP